MFAPPGYVFIPHLYMALFERSFVLTADFDYWQVEGDNPDLDDQVKRAAFAAEGLIEFLRFCPSLSVCSPEGKVLRISKGILHKRIGSELPMDFEFIEPHSDGWLVSVQGDESKWREVARESVSDKNALKVVDLMLNGLKAAQEVYRQFDGWALTFARDDWPNGSDEMDKLLDPALGLDPSEFDTDSSSAPARGRPRKQEAAKRAYDLLFPGGHQGSSMKLVLMAVSNHLGEVVSETTMRRALQQSEGDD